MDGCVLCRSQSQNWPKALEEGPPSCLVRRELQVDGNQSVLPNELGLTSRFNLHELGHIEVGQSLRKHFGGVLLILDLIRQLAAQELAVQLGDWDFYFLQSFVYPS